MSLSSWKVVPPKASAWRVFMTRARKRQEIWPLLSVMSISPSEAILVLPSARSASWLLTWVTWLLIFIGPGGSTLKMFLASVASARNVASV
jgi:hypothetical protein